MCAFLFDSDFKVILFKLFILPSYDYCSTLFFHFSNQTDSNRLVDFKVILFKLFILPSYDYCSTLFFHFSNQTDSNRLVKSFSKNIFKFLKIKLYTVNNNNKNKRCNYEMD